MMAGTKPRRCRRNELSGNSKVGNCGAPACTSIADIKEGVACCSGKKKVSNILGRGNSSLQFNGLQAPADGMYYVTWCNRIWKNDNFGDRDCGGDPHTASGCRPHQLTVNGVDLPKTYHFPCFPGRGTRFTRPPPPCR